MGKIFQNTPTKVENKKEKYKFHHMKFWQFLKYRKKFYK